MQTISIQIQDGFMQNFLNFVNNHSQEIKIQKDSNLELDPYFYERQKEIQDIRNNIKNGKIQMVSHDKIWNNIKQHLKTIK